MDSKLAEFVCWIGKDAPWDEVINDAKALTWEYECEHAVLVTQNRIAMVRGGRLGIEFIVKEGEPYDPSGSATTSLFVEVDGALWRVDRILFHTHPFPTGPSDWDLKVLALLGQDDSRIFEIGGDREGTLIRPKRR